MNPRSLAPALAATLLAFGGTVHAQLSIRDDLGRPLVVKQAATRIVTLAPSLTELVYAAGAGDLVVGVDSLSDYPPEARKVAQVVTGARFSIETLAKLKPDLVLAWRDGIRREDVERITAFGATVFVAQARQLDDVPRLLEMIGRLSGRDAGAVVVDFESRVERLRRANAGKPRMTAFLEIWNRPLTTISGSHFLSEALDICRADNVFRDRSGAAPKVSWEDLARADPHVIVGAGSASNAGEFRSNWALRQSLTAVRARRLVYLDSDTIQRPTPRTPEGIGELCATLDKVRSTGGVPAAVPPAEPRLIAAPPLRAEPAPVAPRAPAAASPAPAPEEPPAEKKPRRPSQYGM